MLVSVLGTGYLGATHAACLADGGHRVIGIDTDPDRLGMLRSGRAPFHEPELDDLLKQGVRSGRLRFSDDLADAVDADVHFLCLGTPQQAVGDQADLSALWSVVAGLAPLLSRDCVVVGKSTVPVGTAAQIRDALPALVPSGVQVSVAWNPEFLREGQAVRDSLRPDRLVVGVEDDHAWRVLQEVYASVTERGVPVIRTDLATAELAKVSANAMLAARISLVNLLAEVCEASGADITALTTILGSDPRIGPHFLRPGLGYGGGCLPKDTRAFVARAAELGVVDSGELLAMVDRVNLHQRSRTVARAHDLLSDSGPGARVGILGAAFKSGSDDVRDSPALEVARRLHEDGFEVRVHDPEAGDNARRSHPQLCVVETVADACAGADLLLVLTDWPEFACLDPGELGEVVRARRVLDARLVLDPHRWRAAGWDVHALGRRSPSPVTV